MADPNQEINTADAPDGSLLGWWAIPGELLIECMQRAAAGESIDMIYAEIYANSEHEVIE